MDSLLPYLEVLLPSAGIFLIFFFVYRTLIRADKGEREAYARAVEEYQQKNAPNASSGIVEGSQGPSQG